MLDQSLGTAGLPANAGLMAAEQVLVQQQHFEQILNERAERERAAKEAARAEARAAETYDAEDDAVQISLTSDSSDSENAATGFSEGQKQAAPDAPHSVDISV